jgi:tetratricopeptide (TPR) repeat protein
MFFAPISEVVTRSASKPGREMLVLEPSSALVLLVVALVALLTTWTTISYGQEAPSQFGDLAARAAAARDQQNLPLAIELYGNAVQAKPDWAEGWFYLGLLQYSENQFPPAIEAFNHLLELQPKAVPAMALRGLCEFETGAYDDSLRDLEQAVAHGAANEPRNEEIIRFQLAQLLTRAGRFQDATTQLAFFASRPVDNPDLLAGLGVAGMRVSVLVKDIPALDREMYEAAGKAGYTFFSGNSEGANDLFSAIFARYPSAPNLHFFYGFLLFPHAPDLAVDQFQSEVDLAPANLSAHEMLAFTLMIDGRYNDALPEAERAYVAEPEVELAQLALGRSLAETGDVQRATDLLKQVLQRDPNNLEAHLGLVAIYSRTGRREDAYRERKVCLGLGR